MILLIYPPVAKPCEPPAGISRLSAMLGRHKVEHRILDANIDGLLHLLQMPFPAEKVKDAWTRRAFRNIEQNISSIRDPGLYRNPDRYKRTVRDIGRVLSKVSLPGSAVGLANYGHKGLSPLKSKDLLNAAEQPELNPFYPYFRTRLEGLFREKEPSVAGISLNYLSQALCAFAMTGFIKREFPGVRIILGGGLVTSWLKNPRWKNPFSGLVDHFVAGPGEYQLLPLLGLAAAEEKLPMPDYISLPRDKYLSPGFVLPYSASTGCYWNRCGFCPEKAEENPYVPIPAQQVISDLTTLKEKTRPVLIHFLDNAISPVLLKALTADNTGIPWYGFARISALLADPDFCIALRRSGCVMLKLGIESGDQEVLDSLEKGINVETASVVLKNLKNAGIAAYVYLIFGTHVETEAGARKTLEFTVRHSDSIGFLNLAIFNMPACGKAGPGIETREFYEGDLSLYTDFIHPKGWDRRRVRLFLENEFTKHPAVSKILKNDPPVFTSNHAPFFVMEHSKRDSTEF
ncbi:MAG: hypothetical protein Q8M71_05035 [Thermodesulfovibrionales bacterium]|nr:hypothetical protein [Thermodesulfovibrionales bacterium]